MADLYTSAGARSTPTAALGLAQEVPEAPAHECRGTRLSSEKSSGLEGPMRPPTEEAGHDEDGD